AGTPTSFNLGSFSDTNSGANSWTVDVNWGDNTSHSTFTTFSQGSIGNVAHTYAPAGTYTATVKVTDNLNASGSTSFQVNVSGSPNGVVVTSPGNQAATAGNAALVLLGSFSDSNSGANPWTVDVNWGDNTVHSDFVTTVQGSLGGAIHAFAQGGNYTVTVTVTNNLNAFASAFFQVSVAGSTKGVTVTPPGYQPVATFTDPGGAEAVSDYSANISWGDGSTPTAGLISLRGTTFTVSGSRTFAEEGSYTISVTINHEGTTPQTVTSIATVSNPNVLATGGFSFSASEASASSTQPVATFTDPGGPGEPSDYSASITWGDGSAASTGSISLTGTTFTVSGSHSYGEEGTDAITVTINHETTTPQTVTSTATVSDPAVVGSSVTVSATAGSPFFKQVVATFTDPGGAEPNPADPSGTIAKHYKVVSINWGDNTALDASSASLSYSGSPGSKSNPFTVTGSHTYAAAGTYTISVLVNHEGVVSTLTGSASVSNLGQFITSGNPQTKTSSFWASIVGQELLRRFGLTAGGQTLGQWLASTLPKLYGGVGGAPNLSSFTDSQVAIYYLGLFSKSNTIRLDSEALSAALYVFATTSSLGGSIAASPPYSLPVTAAGLGAFAVNIGFNGAAFGVPNFTVLNVFQILQATDNSAVAGEPWGSNGVLRNEGLSVFQPINGE
ncbi:MAG TPA: hypothetical protein VKU02_23525, partial [Gemmataceae bacterium]|nr:hypothetical protein [Gemmataceae bacterium]